MEDITILRTAIDDIHRRPGMFLSARSLKEFNTFLSGFCYGLDMGLPLEEGFHGGELRLFQEWLVKRLPDVQNGSWSDKLLSVENGDDEAAFARFFVLWEEYLKQAS